MCRRSSLDLPASPASVGLARQFLSEACARWEFPALRDDVLLALSEIVTNAVLHARTPLSVRAAVVADVLEVGVRDTDPQPPVVRARRDDLVRDLDLLSAGLPGLDDPDPRHPDLWVGEAGSVAAGRGLHLVSAIADAWGVTPFPWGKEVWFTRAVPTHWPYTGDCTCPTSAERTAGGRPVRHVPGPWDRDRVEGLA